MTRRTFMLVHAEARRRAAACCMESPDGYMVTVSEPMRRQIQNDKYHAMLDDISKQREFMGRKWDADDWKRLLVEAFAKTMREAGTPLHHDGRVVPSLDGQRVVQLGIQTRDFYVREAAEFIEFLYAWGAEQGVEWTEPAAEPA